MPDREKGIGQERILKPVKPWASVEGTYRAGEEFNDATLGFSAGSGANFTETWNLKYDLGVEGEWMRGDFYNEDSTTNTFSLLANKVFSEDHQVDFGIQLKLLDSDEWDEGGEKESRSDTFVGPILSYENNGFWMRAEAAFGEDRYRVKQRTGINIPLKGVKKFKAIGVHKLRIEFDSAKRGKYGREDLDEFGTALTLFLRGGENLGVQLGAEFAVGEFEENDKWSKRLTFSIGTTWQLCEGFEGGFVFFWQPLP